MGVDWFKCEKCTAIVCDAGDYESCDGCGARFCNRKCAEIKTTFDDDGEEEQACVSCRGEIADDAATIAALVAKLAEARRNAARREEAMSAITDDEIAALDKTIAGATTAGRRLGDEPLVNAIALLISRVSADAATIENATGWLEERNETIARLRAVAMAAQHASFLCHYIGEYKGRCKRAPCPPCTLAAALSALAPGDLGGEG